MVQKCNISDVGAKKALDVCFFFNSCTFFFAALPLLLVNLLLLSMEAALRRGDLPLFPPSGFSIHHELFPVPSFWTRIKRLCSDRLCLMEFWRRERKREAGWGADKQRDLRLPFSQKPLRSAFCTQVQIHPYRWLSFKNTPGFSWITQEKEEICFRYSTI